MFDDNKRKKKLAKQQWISLFKRAFIADIFIATSLYFLCVPVKDIVIKNMFIFYGGVFIALLPIIVTIDIIKEQVGIFKKADRKGRILGSVLFIILLLMEIGKMISYYSGK